MLEEKKKANLDSNDGNRHYCDSKVFFPKVTTTKKKKVGNNLFFSGFMCNCALGKWSIRNQNLMYPLDLISRTVQAIFFWGQLYLSLSFNRAFNEYMLKLRNNKNTFEYAVRLNTKAAIAQVYKNKIPSLP